MAGNSSVTIGSAKRLSSGAGSVPPSASAAPPFAQPVRAVQGFSSVALSRIALSSYTVLAPPAASPPSAASPTAHPPLPRARTLPIPRMAPSLEPSLSASGVALDANAALADSPPSPNASRRARRGLGAAIRTIGVQMGRRLWLPTYVDMYAHM